MIIVFPLSLLGVLAAVVVFFAAGVFAPLLLIAAVLTTALLGRRLRKRLLEAEARVDVARQSAQNAAAAAEKSKQLAIHAAQRAHLEPARAATYACEARSAAEATKEASQAGRSAFESAVAAAAEVRKLGAGRSSAPVQAAVRRTNANVESARRAMSAAKRATREAQFAAAEAAWAEVRNRWVLKGTSAARAIADPVRGVFKSLRNTMQGADGRRREVSDASMAACALIAAADGEVSSEEKERVQLLLQSNGVLSALASRRLSKSFERYCATLLASATGKLDVFGVIHNAKLSPDEARTVVEVGLVSSRGTEGLTAAERTVALELLDRLGVRMELLPSALS